MKFLLFTILDFIGEWLVVFIFYGGLAQVKDQS